MSDLGGAHLHGENGEAITWERRVPKIRNTIPFQYDKVITLLSTSLLFHGPSKDNNHILRKLSLLLSFSSTQLLYSEGPLDK